MPFLDARQRPHRLQFAGGVAAVVASSCVAAPAPAPPRRDDVLLSAAGDRTCTLRAGEALHCWGGARPSLQPSRSRALAVPADDLRVLEGMVCLRRRDGWQCNDDDGADVAPPPVDAYTLALTDEGACALDAASLRCRVGELASELPRARSLVHAGSLACAVADGMVMCTSLSQSGALRGSVRAGSFTAIRPGKSVAVGSEERICSWDTGTITCTDPSRSRPLVTTAPGGVTSMVIGRSLCVLVEDGDVFCRLLDDDAAWRLKMTSATSLVAGRAHVCAAFTDGRVWCSGDNSMGQLHQGSRLLAGRGPREVVDGRW